MTSQTGSPTAFLTLEEVPQESKNRVVQIAVAFDGEPFGIGVAAAGLSVLGFSKKHPELNIDPTSGESVLPHKRQIAVEEFTPNRDAYESLVVRILQEEAHKQFESLLADTIGDVLGPEAKEAFLRGEEPSPELKARIEGDFVNTEEQADNAVTPAQAENTTEAPAPTSTRRPCSEIFGRNPYLGSK